VKRGSSAMSMKSGSLRAWMRLEGLREMARVRCSRASSAWPVMLLRRAVVGEVGVGHGGEDRLELVASLLIGTGIEERDGVVVLLFGGFEGEGGIPGVALANGEVDAGALEDFRRALAGELVEEDASLLELALLHELEGVLIVLEDLFVLTRGRSGFAGGRAGRAASRGCFSCFLHTGHINLASKTQPGVSGVLLQSLDNVLYAQWSAPSNDTVRGAVCGGFDWDLIFGAQGAKNGIRSRWRV
jgi:hypothetical protein